MADLKISALPASTTPLAGTELVPIVQSSTTKQVSVANLTAGRAVSAGSLAVTNGATFDTTTLVVDATNHKVAVGTTTTTYGNFTVYNSSAVSTIALTDGTLNNSYGGAVRGYGSGGLGGQAEMGVLDGGTYTKGLQITEAGNNVKLFINGTAKLTLDPTNATLANANFVPGTAAKGVNFTANTPQAGMTSQLLNWYEEGTFTPTFGNLTVGNGSTWGAYVKTGKMVQVTLGFTWGSTSSIAGTIGNISGLPFTPLFPGTNANFLATGVIYKAGVGWYNIVSVLTSGNLFVVTATFTGTGISSVSPAAFASNDSLTLSITYRSV